MKRNLLDFLIPMALYAAVLIPSCQFVKNHPDSPWRVPVAIAPVAPLAFIVLTSVKRVRAMDELAQRKYLEAGAFAYPAMIVLSITYGFLQNVENASCELDVRRRLDVLALRSGSDTFLAQVPVKSRVRALRTERDWSQGELARRLGVSRQTVNAIETEKYDPSLPLAFRVSPGVSPAYREDLRSPRRLASPRPSLFKRLYLALKARQLSFGRGPGCVNEPFAEVDNLRDDAQVLLLPPEEDDVAPDC